MRVVYTQAGTNKRGRKENTNYTRNFAAVLIAPSSSLSLIYGYFARRKGERERERETTPNTVGNHKDVLHRSMDSEERKRLKPVGGGAGKTRFMDGGNQI